MISKISALSFVFQEAHVIEVALQQLRPYVEEIIIVDQQSPDGTADIARKYDVKVHTRPRLICGDGYREFLRHQATQPWILWFYPDERFVHSSVKEGEDPEATLKSFEALTKIDKYSCFSFMRHEFMDGVELPFERFYPNYQTRLIRNLPEIQYPDLVHFNMWGHNPPSVCNLPPELYMEHHKTSESQSFDNWRLYVSYKELLHKYRNTDIEPYKVYLDSYKDIILKSEEKNLLGERLILLQEEFWWEWWKYESEERLTLQQFKERTGIEYNVFIEKNRLW
mgnify:CR=1 FL=1